MITVTFNPQTEDEASLVGGILTQYLRAGRADAPHRGEPPVPALPAPEAKKTRARTDKAAPTPVAAVTEEPITLEVLRARLAELGANGKGPQVRELLATFGASRLTDLDAERYSEAFQAAGAL